MSKVERYRNEWKYLIDTAQKELICQRLKPLLKLDENERESFVEAIYELMTVTDAKTLKDIVSDKLGFLMALGKLSKESKKDISKNIAQIIEEIAKIKGKK